MAEDKKILIIEDEEPLLDSYAKLVEMAGYIAVKASDGYQGLDILANNLDQIDLVLLDLILSLNFLSPPIFKVTFLLYSST